METPLVSVVVITYNSSKYILECLDSIYNQTYQNIELIITDDCSKDNTVEVCKKWLEQFSDRFIQTKQITTTINTGTSANCNRGISETMGKWYKIIAGDDRLLKNCIEDNIHYVVNHKNVDFLFSDIKPFGQIELGHKGDYFQNLDKYFKQLTPGKAARV